MKKLLFALLLVLPVCASAQYGTVISNSLDVSSARPVDRRSHKLSSGSPVVAIPYATTTEANAAIATTRRYEGLTVCIGAATNCTEYWYHGGTADGNLVLKFVDAGGGTSYTAGYGVTIASNVITVDTSSGIKKVATQGYADRALAAYIPAPLWSNIQSKPSSFAPSAHTHPLSDITQSGATTGQVALYNGTAWVPGTVSGGGGGTTYTAGTGITISGSVISLSPTNGIYTNYDSIPDVDGAAATHKWAKLYVDSYYVAKTTYASALVRLDSAEARIARLGGGSGGTGGGGGGGGAAGTYAGVSGVFLDLDADSAMTFSSGATLATWDNLAGNDATTVGGTTPTLIPASGSANPAFVDFGSTDEMRFSGLAIPSGTTAITIYAVIKQPTASGGTMFILGPSGSSNTTGFGIQSQIGGSNTVYSYFFGNVGASDAYSAINPLAWQLVKITLNKNLTTGEVRVDMNGGSTSTPYLNNANNTNTFGTALNAALGAEYGAGGSNWTGGIAKIIMIAGTAPPTSPEDSAIKAALSARYSTYSGAPPAF